MTDQKVAVVTDSGAYIPDEALGELDIPVIPLWTLWDGERLRDSLDIDPPTFYARLRESDTFPTTSQPSSHEFVQFFRQVAEEKQTDAIVAVLISSGVSSTVATAEAAVQELPELRIRLVDSLLISMGMGFPALAAARAAEAGKSLDEVARVAEDVRDRTQLLGVVGTLEFLHRGGRIGGARRLLGTALNIKPVLHFEDGRIEPLTQVRTRRKALQRMLDEAEERLAGKPIAEAAVADVDCPAEGDRVAGMVEERFGVSPVYRCPLSPAVGAHAGPGTVCFIFYPQA